MLLYSKIFEVENIHLILWIKILWKLLPRNAVIIYFQKNTGINLINFIFNYKEIRLLRTFWVCTGPLQNRVRSLSTSPWTQPRTRLPCGTTGSANAPSGPSTCPPSSATSPPPTLLQLRLVHSSNVEAVWKSTVLRQKYFENICFSKVFKVFQGSFFFLVELIQNFIFRLFLHQISFLPNLIGLSCCYNYYKH